MIFGIDPGYSGAVCSLPEIGPPTFYLMPTTGDRKSRDYNVHGCAWLLNEFKPSSVCIEAFASFALGAKTAQSLVRCVTIWEVLCLRSMVRHHIIKSQTWQKLAFEGTPAEMKPKERARIAARRIFAGSDTDKWTEGQRDAALIAWYGARQA